MIDGLIRDLRRSKADMVVARMDLKGLNTEYSGERAIKVSALKGFIKGAASWKELAQGYGLEYALNHLVPKKEKSSLLFRQGRGVRMTNIMQSEMTRAFGLVDRRKESAKKY